MKKALFFPLQITLCTVGYLYASSSITHAQVTSDATVNTQVNQDGNVAEITGGETRGGNLFHSFQDFSVPTGNEAFFNHANDISNIFSRVTGGNISNIDGAIRANGTASLFLINPAGIIFGENARLDIGGSFYGNTADSILFPDTIEFSATDTQAQPVLTINAPIGLSFRDDQENIVNRSVANDGKGLEMSPGNNITLLGGEVNFDGGNITAPGGIVNLGGLEGAGTININADGSLNLTEITRKEDVSLINSSTIDIRGSDRGKIIINANNLKISNNSGLFAGILEGINLGNAQAGEIDIDVTQQLEISENSQIDASTLGEGNAGTIFINAQDQIVLEDNNFLGIRSIVGSDAVGNGGSIDITTTNLSLSNGSLINASTFGQGNAGTIFIDAREQITVDGDGAFSGIVNFVGSEAFGNGGSIDITTTDLSLVNAAQVGVDTLGEGNSGTIFIDAQSQIFLEGTQFNGTPGGLSARGGLNSTQNGGNIEVITSNLVISNGATIRAQSLGSAGGGNLSISTDSLTLEDRASILATTVSGNGGNADIQVSKQLSLRDNSSIRVGAVGNGNGGNVEIDAKFIIAFPSQFPGDGNDIIASVQEGLGGNIDVRVDRVLGILPGEAEPGNGSNDFEASSSLSIEQNIVVNILDSATLSPPNLIESEQTTAQACEANREAAAKNVLTISGKGGIIPEPGLPLNSLNIYVNGESTSAIAIPAPMETSKGKIQPARGVKVTEFGEVILTAYRTNNSGDRLSETRNCV